MEFWEFFWLLFLCDIYNHFILNNENNYISKYVEEIYWTTNFL